MKTVTISLVRNGVVDDWMANASKKLHLLRLISGSVEIDCLNCVVRSLSVVPQVRLLVAVWLKRAKVHRWVE